MHASRFFLYLAPVLVLALAVPGRSATKFVVSLDSGQEVGTVSDPVGATGTGSLTLVDLGGGNFSWEYSVTISPELNFSTVAGDAAGKPGGGSHPSKGAGAGGAAQQAAASS